MKTVLTGIAVALLSSSAGAAQLDSLKGLMGGSGGSLTSNSAGNAAGVIQYCMTNNYLGGSSGAAGVKEKLLGSTGKATAAPTQDKGYLEGAQGILKSSDGKSLNLAGAGQDTSGTGDIKAKLTQKVCAAVLKQGKKMAGMGT